MDHSFREQGSTTQQNQDARSYWTSLRILGNLIKRLTDFFQWTEEEQEDAGIYIDRLGDE